LHHKHAKHLPHTCPTPAPHLPHTCPTMISSVLQSSVSSSRSSLSYMLTYWLLHAGIASRIFWL
jgi:hypothetical protein